MSAKRGERVLGPYHQRSGWLVIRIYADNTRETAVFPTEAKAARYIEVVKADLETGDHTTETAIEEYRRHLTKKGNKADSIRQTCWALEMFFPDAILLSMLTDTRCEKLFEQMCDRPTKTGKPMSVDSRRNTLSQVKTFLAWCGGKPRYWIRGNPCADVKDEYGDRRPRGKALGLAGNELHIDQTRQWYGMALYRANRGDRGAIAALCALLCGMRASEITELRVAAVDKYESACDRIHVIRGKTKKSKRALVVPAVLRPFIAALVKDKEPTALVFDADGGAHWRDWIRKNVARICKLAGVPEVTAHAMRGQLATISTAAGLAGEYVAATLGHEDVRTTMTAYAAPGSAEAGALARGRAVLDRGEAN